MGQAERSLVDEVVSPLFLAVVVGGHISASLLCCGGKS